MISFFKSLNGRRIETVKVIWPINKLDQDFASAKEPVWDFFI